MADANSQNLDRWGSMSEVGRVLGISPQAISKHKKKGLLKQRADGLVHIGRSVEAIQITRDPDAALKGLAGGQNGKGEPADDLPINPQAAAPPSAPRVVHALAQARAVGAIADAKHKELKLAQQRGELIPKDAVRRAALAVVSEIKTRFEGLASQAAPVVHAAPTVAEGEALLRGMVRAILIEISKLGEVGQ